MRFPIQGYSTLLTAVLALAPGCGGLGLGITDGGPVGTGIAASVVGNVVAVEEPGLLSDTAASGTAAASDMSKIAQLDGIEVSLVEVPGAETVTDEDGNFSLEGDFVGRVTLRFRTGDLELERKLEVPTGGIIVLSDIELDRDDLTIEAGRQLALHGLAEWIDCARGALVVASRDDQRFEVELLPETSYLDGESTIACEDVTAGDEVSVEGVFADDFGISLRALVVSVTPEDPAQPAERLVAFLGNVVAIDCTAGAIRIHDGRHGIRIRLSDDTVIRRAGERLACEDLSLGDSIVGGGVLDLRRPGRVEGRLLVVTRRLATNVELPIRGFVAARECDRNVLILDFEGAILLVRLRPDTELTPAEAVCELIPIGTSVRGKGVVSPAIPGGVDARSLQFRKVRNPS